MELDKIWKDTAAELKGQMTRARFTSVQQARVVSLEGDVLTLSAPGLAVERLEYMSTAIEKAATHAAGTSVRVRFVSTDAAPHELVPAQAETPAQTNSPVLSGSAAYHHKYNEVVKPESHWTKVTDYFRTRWLPLLGPTLAWVIVDLRRRCFYGPNIPVDQWRDSFLCTIADVAKSIGVDEGTVHRSLNRPCVPECPQSPHKIAEHFIAAEAPQYRDRDGKKICIGTAFKIYLDEPYAPDGKRSKRRTKGPDAQNASQVTT